MKFKTFLSFVAGLGTGFAAGILFAPRPGKATRKIIVDEADGLIEKAIMMKLQNTNVAHWEDERRQHAKERILELKP
jgi:gas vesicle protein